MSKLLDCWRLRLHRGFLTGSFPGSFLGVLFGLILQGAGCAGSAGNQHRGGSLSRSEPALWAELQAQRNGDTLFRAVSLGEVLHGGDRFNVKVAVEQQGYLYVALAPPDGSLDVLVPGQGETPLRLAPGSLTYAPGPGAEQGWILDEHKGVEHLYVVASTRPLTRAELGTEITAVLPTPLAEGRDPPPVADSKSRTGTRRQAMIAAPANQNGVAVVHLKFQHD